MRPEIVAGLLMQGKDLDRLSTPQAFTKIRIFCQCDNHMAIAISRHVVDQVDQAILEAADSKTIDEMHHKRRLNLRAWRSRK